MLKQQLQDTYARVIPHIHRTPVLSSTYINGLVGAEVFFKCENFQRMGAFKMRGAVNAILQLSDEQRSRGVVTHSSGNFAQAVSLAARSLGVKAHIVMPENAPQVKKAAVRGYGGEITEVESTLAARQQAADKIVAANGAAFLHPSNDLAVILGQGTACMELLEDQPNLDAVLTPVGGGGLVAGTSLVSHFFGHDCETIGAEPAAADDAHRSLQSGKIETNESANTIADGLRTTLGDINFPIIQKHVTRIFTVSEIEIVQAMKMIWERMKIVIEPSSAVALAALLQERADFQGKKVGIIISGGNVDLAALPF